MEGSFPLPLEIVLNIITCSLPASTDALLDAAHPTTKLLLTFTLVCHETRRLANRYLRQHCVYINSERRLSSYLRAIPDRPALCKVTSLSLAPFQDDIDDLPLCSWVRELLCFACETLRKLVIDMPLRSCYPEDDHLAVRPVLRAGFERLVNLEEFVSTRDELYLDTFDQENAFVWMSWPKLKRLALWNVMVGTNFWRHIALHPALGTLVLSAPDGILDVDPKEVYFEYTSRPIRILICHYRRGRSGEPDIAYANWELRDPEQYMTIYRHSLPDSIYIEDAQQHIKNASESSTLWHWEGQRVTDPDSLRLAT